VSHERYSIVNACSDLKECEVKGTMKKLHLENSVFKISTLLTRTSRIENLALFVLESIAETPNPLNIQQKSSAGEKAHRKT
jgi:hypothetical protein